MGLGQRNRRTALALAAAVAVGAAAGIAGRCARTQAAGGGQAQEAQQGQQPDGGDHDGGSGEATGSAEAAGQPEGTVGVTYPAMLVAASGESASQFASDGTGLDEGARDNGDGTVTVWYTPAQLAAHEERARGDLGDAIASAGGRGVGAEVSGDFRSVTLTAGEGATAAAVHDAALFVVADAADVQICQTLGEGFSMSVDIVDGSTGEVMEHFDQDSYATWGTDYSWLDPSGGAA